MRIWTATMDPTAVTIAKTLVLAFVGPGHGVLLRATISQVGLTASEMLRVKLQEVSQGGSVGTAIVPKPLEVGGGAFPTIAISNLTTEPGAVTGKPYVEEAFNLLNGWTWVPMPEERPIVNVGSAVALRLDVAPSASAVFSAQFTIGLFG